MTINRKLTKKINIGSVEVGGNSPISVQSMCTTDTRDIKSTVHQINELEDAGCEIIRVAVPDKLAAEAINDIRKQISIPLVADIHFDYRLAISSIENGADAIRLNPGNIGKVEFVQKVVDVAKERNIPIRIGVNSGSLEKGLQNNPEELVKSALKHVEILENLDFDLIKLSLKSSNVQTMIDSYKLISSKIQYPLHLGVTEAGTLKTGLVKSSIGIGTLVEQGIGDTIRVSLTDNPVEEVYAGFEILKALEVRKKGVNIISCPTCGRCQINLINLAKKVEELTRNINTPLDIAVMGCAVNGPGEAKGADIGIAGGIGEGYIFKKGEILKKVPEEKLLEEFIAELKQFVTNM